MGVLPLQFKGDTNVASLHLTGEESFDIVGIDDESQTAAGRDAYDTSQGWQHGSEVPVLLRIDTPIEVDYYRHGGIMPYVLRELVAQSVGHRKTDEARRSKCPMCPSCCRSRLAALRQ